MGREYAGAVAVAPAVTELKIDDKAAFQSPLATIRPFLITNPPNTQGEEKPPRLGSEHTRASPIFTAFTSSNKLLRIQRRRTHNQIAIKRMFSRCLIYDRCSARSRYAGRGY